MLGGTSGDFTLAECQAFTSKYLEYSNLGNVLPADEMTEFREGLPAECMSKKMGLSREELDCGVKANNLDEFRACGDRHPGISRTSGRHGPLSGPWRPGHPHESPPRSESLGCAYGARHD
jgi:hypothetical protein